MTTSVLNLVVKKFGAPDEAKPVPQDVINEYEHLLPNDLLAFWKDFGIGLWQGGKFQLCLPSAYTQIIAELSAGDLEISPKTAFVVGFSAFGELLVWSTALERLTINLPIAEVLVPKLDHRERDDPAQFPLAIPLMRMDRPGSFDMFEATEEAAPLFARCRQKLGPLHLGECYGLVPALGLGGQVKLSHFEKMNAKIHFKILAGLGRFQLMTFRQNGALERLRYLGANPA